jgi:hypothetical protein
VDKSIPKLLAASVIFKIVPKENKRPIGEKSPNLVTLHLSQTKPTSPLMTDEPLKFQDTKDQSLSFSMIKKFSFTALQYQINKPLFTGVQCEHFLSIVGEQVGIF